MLKSVNAETPRTLSQTVFGTRYIDEPVCRDRNTDDDPNCLDSGGSERYYYHQDINFGVVALSDESGAVVERYEYTAYGEPRVYAGGAGESGCLLSGSTVGNPHMHQGLRLDDESGLYENRFRMYHARLGRFVQRDPLGYVDGLNLFEYARSTALARLDPLGGTSLAPPPRRASGSPVTFPPIPNPLIPGGPPLVPPIQVQKHNDCPGTSVPYAPHEDPNKSNTVRDTFTEALRQLVILGRLTTAATINAWAQALLKTFTFAQWNEGWYPIVEVIEVSIVLPDGSVHRVAILIVTVRFERSGEVNLSKDGAGETIREAVQGILEGFQLGPDFSAGPIS